MTLLDNLLNPPMFVRTLYVWEAIFAHAYTYVCVCSLVYCSLCIVHMCTRRERRWGRVVTILWSAIEDRVYCRFEPAASMEETVAKGKEKRPTDISNWRGRELRRKREGGDGGTDTSREMVRVYPVYYTRGIRVKHDSV